MKKSIKKYEYDQNYNKKNYDRIALLVNKGKKDIYKKQAESEGLSLNKWITQLLDNAVNEE